MLLRTKEVLEKTRITRQTLYRYLTAGLIKEAAVTESGRMLFSPEVISRIKLIKELNESGYTLQELKEIFFYREGKKRKSELQLKEKGKKRSS